MDDPSMHKPAPGRFFAACLVFSLFGHLVASTVFERFGSYDFGAAITQSATVMVDLTPPKQQTPETVPVRPKRSLTKPPPTTRPVASITSVQQLDVAKAPSEPAQPVNPPQQTEQGASVPQSSGTPHQQAVPEPATDIFTKASDLVPVEQEKLVYQISLSGVPVGSAQLEATNTNGEVRIQSTIRSNSVVSSIYTVNDSTDTRLIKGRYLLTRIKQHEGLFKSDTGFTIMYPDRKIFWVDRLKKRYSNEPLESLDTLDFVSGFYFLRQKALKTGDRFSLRLYDGDTTTTVPVAVLRKEELALPGMRSADTLVVQPAFAESGFFKNNRDLLVWFTNDSYRVPVRFEATTPLGRVVAELVSSERVMQSVGHSDK